jgi:hypothetical protein
VLAQSRKDIVAWVGNHVLPREAAVRAWLRRWTGRAQDIDDAIQEAYSRLDSLNSISHIDSGRAYLFQTTRSPNDRIFIEIEVTDIPAATCALIVAKIPQLPAVLDARLDGVDRTRSMS